MTCFDIHAGVIFTRADKLDINTISDLKNKTIAALKISNFAQAQVQLYMMHRNGDNFIMDPKQVVFTGKQVLCPEDAFSWRGLTSICFTA